LEGERRAVEKMQERFLKCLRVEGKTPKYFIREETQRWLLKNRAGRKAWDYEERLEEGRGSVLVQICLRKTKDRALKGRVVGLKKKKVYIL